MKIKLLSSFAHPHDVPNMHDFLLFVGHKKKPLAEWPKKLKKGQKSTVNVSQKKVQANHSMEGKILHKSVQPSPQKSVIILLKKSWTFWSSTVCGKEQLFCNTSPFVAHARKSNGFKTAWGWVNDDSCKQLQHAKNRCRNLFIKKQLSFKLRFKLVTSCIPHQLMFKN